MLNYNYRLDELQELGSILEIKDRFLFVAKFAEMTNSLLREAIFDRLLPLSPIISADYFDTGRIMFAQQYQSESVFELCQKEWQDLKENADYKHDEFLLDDVKNKLNFIQSSRKKMEQVYKKLSFYNFCKMWRERTAIVKERRGANKFISVHQLLSIAATYYCRQGWGNERDFSRALRFV